MNSVAIATTVLKVGDAVIKLPMITCLDARMDLTYGTAVCYV